MHVHGHAHVCINNTYSVYEHKSCAHVCNVVSSGVVDTGWSVATSKTSSQNIASRAVIIFKAVLSTVTTQLHCKDAGLDHNALHQACVIVSNIKNY